MLGLNPGLDEALPADYTLQKDTCLLGDPHDREAKRIAYWRNARRCFGARIDLERALARATFSFCCPFRTPNWSSLNKNIREALQERSRPILRQILQDCTPAYVVCAGSTAAALFRDLGGVAVASEIRSTGSAGRKRWTARDAHAPWGTSVIMTIPHFSRFNSTAGLTACGHWLGDQMNIGGPAA
jgi:hypothetical protein